jgi:Chitobiase/beta-hexosaminidase C-terminal domain
VIRVKAQAPAGHAEETYRRTGPKREGRLARGAGALLAASIAAVLLLATAFITPAEAELGRVGPVDPSTGFPRWFEDARGLRLEPCFAGANCSVPAPDADRKPATPGNVGGRVIYWSAKATLHTNGGGTASLTLVSQGGFSPSGEPADGTENAFNRIHIRADNLVPGATYRVTHPYGTETFTDVDGGRRGIDFTEDVGCLQAPCDDFATALAGRVGPWLTWDTLGAPAGGPPAGYIGDAATPHRVVGSPVTDAGGNQQNYFRIKGPDIGGKGDDAVRTNLFVVEGKIARLTAFANPRGGLYKGDQSVTLTASDPAAEIFYTLDGSDPTRKGTRYERPLTLTTSTTLKFVARGRGEVSPVVTQTYDLDG